MKLTYFQVEPHLIKTLAPIYIVSGDEIVLKQEAIQYIRKAAKKSGFSERTRLVPDTGFDWEQLYPLLFSTSLMQEKQIIEIDLRDTLPNKAANLIFEEYAKKPSENNLVLIDCNKIDDKIAKSPWFKSLEKIGVNVTIWPIPFEQLPLWISNRLKKYKLSITQEAAKLLAEYVEGNLVAAAQAIEKLYLLQPDKTIDTDLVNIVLTDESRYSIFELVDTLLSFNHKRSLHILTHLQQEGIEPVLILWAITRELRLMTELAYQFKQGVKIEALLQQHRIYARKQASVRKFLAKFNYQDCLRLITAAAHMDKIIKGAIPGQIWETLQLFCLRIMI